MKEEIQKDRRANLQSILLIFLIITGVGIIVLCPPCVDEMPSMEKLHQELKGDAFEILAVSIDASGAKAVRPFMKKHKLSFHALTDTKGAIKNLYQTTGVPESFIIDKNGVIAEKVIGPMDWATPDVIRYFRDRVQKS
jgi:peroxiredoxin